MTPKLKEALIAELAGEFRWYWLSFCDPTRPVGEQFLGVACVRAPGPLNAISRAKRLGINPGGEVAYEALQGEPPAELAEALVSDPAVVLRLAKALKRGAAN